MDAIERIKQLCYQHNLTMDYCVEICELIAPLCDMKTPSGAVEWLRMILNFGSRSTMCLEEIDLIK